MRRIDRDIETLRIVFTPKDDTTGSFLSIISDREDSYRELTVYIGKKQPYYTLNKRRKEKKEVQENIPEIKRLINQLIDIDLEKYSGYMLTMSRKKDKIQIMYRQNCKTPPQIFMTPATEDAYFSSSIEGRMDSPSGLRLGSQSLCIRSRGSFTVMLPDRKMIHKKLRKPEIQTGDQKITKKVERDQILGQFKSMYESNILLRIGTKKQVSFVCVRGEADIVHIEMEKLLSGAYNFCGKADILSDTIIQLEKII